MKTEVESKLEKDKDEIVRILARLWDDCICGPYFITETSNLNEVVKAMQLAVVIKRIEGEQKQ